MGYDLDGRTALVTGSGRGNGRAMALALAESGADVVVNDVDEEAAEATAADAADGGNGDAVALTADVSDADEVAAMVAEAEEALGAVDVLVNNAGIGEGDRFTHDPGPELWQRQLDVHLWGAINCTGAVLDGMLEAGYGKVVNVTSVHTKNGVGMSPQYDVAKYSLLGLTKTLALELGREGIRVNAVAPGWTETRMTEGFDSRTREQILDLNPLGRFADPEEVADATLFLCAPESDYVNGHELRVDGGQQPIDSWKYRYDDA